MANKTCFVVMAIGDIQIGDNKVTSANLSTKYHDFIKEAILKANPNIEVVRADEVSMPGMITTDIINRIMFSDYVIADVSYPNANVFYELGLRHACKVGTIIIKDKNSPSVPFDISALRYVEYEESPTGLKNLSNEFKKYFDHFDKNPAKPDNHFQELAKLTNYNFPNYSKEEKLSPEIEFFQSIMQSPDALALISKFANGEQPEPQDLIQVVAKNPQIMMPLINTMVSSGTFSFEKLMLNMQQPKQGDRNE